MKIKNYYLLQVSMKGKKNILQNGFNFLNSLKLLPTDPGSLYF